MLERGALDEGQRAEMLRLRGTVFVLAGELERSVADLTAAKELRPRNPLVARALALALSAAGKAPDAEREIERALLLEPSLQGFLIRCMIFTEAGRPADGITDCEAVHQVDPSEESAYLTARAYAKLGRNADATLLLERAVAARNGSPRVRKLLAEVRALAAQSPATNASRR